MNSVLTKSQVKTFGPRFVKGYGPGAMLTAEVRYDDQCGNGHNTFSITGTIVTPASKRRHDIEAGGCLHEEIARVFPSLATAIKWHGCTSEGPLHFIANTVYHADSHGPNRAWVYYSGPADPLGLTKAREQMLAYVKEDDAKRAETTPGYRIEWDEKTAKSANLDHARSSAIWPEATDADLTAPGLEERLAARLPALMAEFEAAVTSLGFTF